MTKIDQDRRDLMSFLKGDAQATRALISRYSSPLLNHATYLLNGDRAMAEDIVQNSFLKLWKNAEKLVKSDQNLQLRAWLFRVMRNDALDQLKRPKMSVVDESFDQADGAQSTLDQLTHEDRAKFVMALVARLPERQKSALLMAHFEDMSNPEIAKILDCSVEAVENLLARARKRLREWAEGEALVI